MITVVVRNERGDLSEARASLQLQVGTWLVSAKVRRVQLLEGGRGQVSVELAINAQERALQGDAWQLTSWELTGGLQGTLEDHKKEELPVYTLKHGKNPFTLFVPPFRLTGPPELKLTILGPGGRQQPVEVSLVGSCAQLLEQQLAGLPKEMEALARKSREALKGTPSEATLDRRYKTQAAEEHELQERFQSIKNNLAILKGGRY